MKTFKRFTIVLFFIISIVSSLSSCKMKSSTSLTPVSELPDATDYVSFKDEETGKYGFKNGGEIVISPEYDRIEGFKENFAVVWKNKRAGYINSAGELVCDYQFVEAGSFSNELAVVRKKDSEKFGFLGTDGKMAIDFIFDNVTAFNSDGIANVILNGEEIWIDKSGNKIDYEAFYAEKNSDSEQQDSSNVATAENNEPAAENENSPQ